MTRFTQIFLVFLIALLLGVVVWSLLRPNSQIVVDPSSNVTVAVPRPENHYVGHLKCAECHSDVHKVHSASPHAHTFATTRDSEIAQSFCGRSVDGGEIHGAYQYSCDDEGLMVGIPDRFGSRLFPLDFALGSGSHAVTFLTLQDEAGETVGVEHRMSWFHEQSRIAVTPGQQELAPTQGMEYFGKLFRGQEIRRCVSCHVTTGELVGQKIQNLRPGVQCERCHGPGSHHVEAASSDAEDPGSMIRSRWNAQEEVTMCGECHRMPSEIEPERLERYPNSLVRFQPVGLLQSRCYLESQSLKCSSCHDPHAEVASHSPEYQVNQCRECHTGADQVACGKAETGNCIECHMPKVELLPGISFHDHWIRVFREEHSAD